MTIFETVKQSVTLKEAANHYGIPINRSNMICCPFHQDKRPSMKLNRDYYYCFGCHESGDVIQFVAKLYNCSNYEATVMLARDFGLSLDTLPKETSERQKLRTNNYLKRKVQLSKEQHCICVLCDYLHLLERWKENYAPKQMDDEPHEHYVKACQMMDYVENLLDTLLCPEKESRFQLVERLLSEHIIDRLETKVKDNKKEKSEYER